MTAKLDAVFARIEQQLEARIEISLIPSAEINRGSLGIGLHGQLRGQLAIRQPGGTFRARFLGFDTVINEVRLTRRVGPAVISRKLSFKEDVAAKHYYDREIIATLPADMPPGAYDLSVQVTGGRRTGICRSPRSVHVVRHWPKDPVLVTFGHLDTSAQYQAEYLERLADMANLIAPDLVLNSNAVNPAYISGALARLCWDPPESAGSRGGRAQKHK